MRVTAITAHVIKAGQPYHPVNAERAGIVLPGTDYFRFSPYPQLYSRRTESVVVKIETDEGLTGWGESQAPLAPEVVAKIIEKLVGPVLLGRNPLDSKVLYSDMIGTSRVRGHATSYQHDAIAGLDMALWDIRGQADGRSLASHLGGRFRDTLPSYSSGLRARTVEERIDEAILRVNSGLGVKPFLSGEWRSAADEMSQLRAAVGDDALLFADGLWSFSPSEAARLGRVLEQNNFGFFEAPSAPGDIRTHSRLSEKLDMPIAIGELLRTRDEFLPWLEAGALGVCQPDLMRNGVTETIGIASLAETFDVPVALHVGATTVIGMAATWQVASALPNFLVQEHQPVMLELFNPWLAEPLSVRDGHLEVPDGPGLGVSIDEARLLLDVESSVTITCA
jgi:galactonate dehydratase